MTIDFKSFLAAYQKWQVEHPKLAGLIVVIESAALGTAADLFMNGVDFSKNGLKHAATLIGVAVAAAVRNYLKTNAANLKLKLEAKANQ